MEKQNPINVLNMSLCLMMITWHWIFFGVGVGYLDQEAGYRSCNALLIFGIEVTTYNSSAFWSLPFWYIWYNNVLHFDNWSACFFFAPHGFTDKELLALSWICTTQNKWLYILGVHNSYRIFFFECVPWLKIVFLSYFHYNVWSFIFFWSWAWSRYSQC